MPDELVPVRTVIKVGGALLDPPHCLDPALALIGAMPDDESVLIVPGGGPFADAIRELDDRLALDADAAHWAAIRGMDAYADILASRLRRFRLIEHPSELAQFGAPGWRAILAPGRWLRSADPLPHSWDVTSDSVAAWVAGMVGANRLVLIKRSSGTLESLTDAHFNRVRPPHIPIAVVNATDLAQLRRVLFDGQAE